MSDQPFDTSNLLVVSFEDDDNAYEALTELKELDSQGQIEVKSAGVVVRQEDGHLVVKDEVGDDPLAGTATGGIVGLLIGVLGGPLGILIGGVTGLLIGSLFDLDDEDEDESVLSDIARAARVGRPTLLAEVDEPSPEVLDTAMAALSGAVLRRPVVDVEAEIAAAEEAQKAAKREARKVLREQRRQKARSEVHEMIERLKAKLHHGAHATSGA
jgi:uncharacterized membrane protein